MAVSTKLKYRFAGSIDRVSRNHPANNRINKKTAIPTNARRRNDSCIASQASAQMRRGDMENRSPAAVRNIRYTRSPPPSGP